LPAGVDVVRGEVNRVPEPLVPNFVVMSQLSQPRMTTNIDEYNNNVVLASIAGAVLTVGAVLRGSLTPGAPLTDGTLQQIQVDTTIVSQLTGTPGGIGTYSVAPSQNLASSVLYAGLTSALVPAEWTVQLDFHGPLSADNATRAAALFRSEYGVDAFVSSGFDVTPLYCGDPSQRPFINAEQEIEYRWSLDAVMQINPVIGTQLSFADELQVTTVDVDGGTTTRPPVP
jgi:hypothetical protein